MLGIVLLVIGLIGLLMTILSLVGVDFGSFDVDFGDSGAGLLSVATPFLTGFGLVAGGMLVFTDSGTPISLGAGAAAGVVLGVAAFAVLGYLVGSEEELPSHDPTGSLVRVVEPVAPGRFGTGEISTPLGTRQITITADEPLAHNDRAVVVARIDGRDGFVVSPMTIGDAPTEEGN